MAAAAIRTKLIPRRVLFNVPADNSKFLAKAPSIEVDCLTLDLEDGVALAKKPLARTQLVDILQQAGQPQTAFPKCRELLVRVNAADTSCFEEDLAALARIPPPARPQAILLPKVESPRQVARLNEWIDTAYAAAPAAAPAIMLAIETAKGIVDLREILGGDIRRVEALEFASEDYCADLGLIRTADATALLWARSKIVAYARKHLLQAIDMVCIDYKNSDQLIRECLDGVAMGFDGKQAIHPTQIEVILNHFKPSAAHIMLAHDILAHIAIHGDRPFEMRGLVVDLPVIKWARLLAASFPRPDDH